MKKCLYCEKEFEEKKDTAKFCSVSHRVMWNRKNSSDKNKSLAAVVFELQKKIDGILDDRNNAFVNAARGRDAIGINEDELKKNKKPIVKNEVSQLDLSNQEVLRQITEIKSEKIPKERDTALGRKVWQNDQNKKIQELEKLLA